MEDWMLDNMHGILIFVEVLWVAGFFSVFILYFFVSRHIRKKRQQNQHALQDSVKEKI